MKLDINDTNQVNKYKDFIKNSQYGSFEQDMRWAELKSGWKSAYFYLEDGAEIVAALSVIYIRDKIGKNFFYAPRGPVAELNDIDLVIRLLEEAADFARANDGFLLRVDPLFPYDEALIEKYKARGIEIRHDKTTSSQPLLNMVLAINGRDSEEIFANFSKNTRKHTRKSYRDGIVTKDMGREGVDILYKHIVDTSERAGINHRPYEYFEKLYSLYEDEIRMSVSYLDDEPLCSSMLISYGNRATSLYGGSSNEFKDMGQNYQINYEEIKFAADKGLAYYDMGGIFDADESDGLYTFKRKFTEENVEDLIGEIDLVLDQDLYDIYIREKNPHFKREEARKNESN
ncbi:peptidoglycan bridge formation glycyltransferase FemA/FemB family protein [Anaerococcus sp. AGMB09787]|uniref:lipid II:glycine glycyltransferase FemX n=1 Tax=Anaerococcus sp. AGMB09787 TaxID=2922869 RepID=UPI001FAF0B14